MRRKSEGPWPPIWAREDKIKLLLQQRGVLLPAASDHGHILRREAFADHLRQQGAAGGGVGAGLHHGGVPGCDSVGQGGQGPGKSGGSTAKIPCKIRTTAESSTKSIFTACWG